VNGNALADTIAVTMTGSDVATLSLVTGDLTAGAYLGALTVTATTGSNVITTGDGNDTIIGGAGVDTIDGDAGTDTVSYADVTGATAHSLTNVAGVAVNLSAAAVTAATIATAAGGTIVIGGAAGSAGANLAAGTAGYLASAAANSTVTMVRDTIANVESVIGSFGTDYIALGAGGMSASGGAGVDDIIGGAGADTITGGAAADVLAGGDGDDTYVYAATTDLFASNALVDTLTEGGSAGTADAIKIDNNGGATFTIAVGDDLGGALNIEKITSGVSDQIISITAKADFHNNGLTTIDLSGDTDATGANIINVAAENQDLDFVLTGSAGVDTITGGTGTDTITGGAGNDIITGGASTDVLVGGTGDDVYIFTATAHLFTSNALLDTITEAAGAGTDEIRIANNGGATFTIAAADALGGVKNIEKITAAASDEVITITLKADMHNNGLQTVDLSGDTTTTANNVIDAALETEALAFTLTGSAGIDTITGGSGADIITGGTGADIFKFTTASTAAPSATVFDTITDFTTASDVFDYVANVTIVTNGTTAASGTGETNSSGITTFHAADSTLALRIIAAEASIATGTAANGQGTAFMFGSDAYVLISDGTDGIQATDTLVKLTGVDLTATATDVMTLSSGDFTLA
jgi:Ca2+-binding RTX toxin-like protein